MERLGKALGVVVAVGTITAGVWAVGTQFGFRPALLAELNGVRELASVTAQQVVWLRFLGLDEVKKRRKLTPQECAVYLELANQLGIPATCG